MRKKYIVDEKRVIKRFLFIPRTVDNEKRWLEFAIIEQICVLNKGKWYWKDIEWINK